MEDWQQRVVTEHAELVEKMSKLRTFMVSSDFVALPRAEQNLMIWQHAAMASYRHALAGRIAIFRGEQSC